MECCGRRESTVRSRVVDRVAAGGEPVSFVQTSICPRLPRQISSCKKLENNFKVFNSYFNLSLRCKHHKGDSVLRQQKRKGYAWTAIRIIGKVGGKPFSIARSEERKATENVETTKIQPNEMERCNMHHTKHSFFQIDINPSIYDSCRDREITDREQSKNE